MDSRALGANARTEPERVLVLFANVFPFSLWEPYLEAELPFLARFDRVEVFSLAVRREHLDSVRKVPSNVSVHVVPFRSKVSYLLRAIGALTDLAFWRELRIGVRRAGFSLKLVTQVAIYVTRAHMDAKHIKRILSKKYSDPEQQNWLFYSYRYLHQPYIASLVSSIVASSVIVSRAHGMDLYEERSTTGILPGRDYNLAIVDRVFTVSLDGKRYLEQRHPDHTDKMAVSYLGTSDCGLNPMPLKDGVVRIVSCSNVQRVKRLDKLIDALALTSGPVEWTHYGDGPLLSRLLAESDRLLKHSNVEVKFIGRVPNAAVKRAYATNPYDVLINVSESEGLPVSIMEALSFGIPVVATDVGGTSEILENSYNGWLLDSDASPSEIAFAIESYRRLSSGEVKSIRENARLSWERSFDSSANYKMFVDELIEMVSRGDLSGSGF